MTSLDKFYKISLADSAGSDIKHVAGVTMEQLASEALKTPGAVGFNSTGWIKSDLSQIGTSTIDLYVLKPSSSGTKITGNMMLAGIVGVYAFFSFM